MDQKPISFPLTRLKENSLRFVALFSRQIDVKESIAVAMDLVNDGIIRYLAKNKEVLASAQVLVEILSQVADELYLTIKKGRSFLQVKS